MYWFNGRSLYSLTSSTDPTVVPLLLYYHILAQLLFLLYTAIIYLSCDCSSCSLTSSTGPMIALLILYNRLLAQRSSYSLTSSSGRMVVLLLLYHHLLVQWLFLLYSTIIYWSNGCSSCTPLSCTDVMVVPLVLYRRRLT